MAFDAASATPMGGFFMASLFEGSGVTVAISAIDHDVLVDHRCLLKFGL